MKLNSPLVTSFIYENQELNIDLSFDNVLDVFDVMSDKKLREYEIVHICLKLLLDEQEYEPSFDLWNYIYLKYIHIERKRTIEYDLKGNPMPHQPDEDGEFMNLEQDAELIYSSFMQAYQIDLFKEQTKLHWLQFKALLNGLPTETIMQRVIQIRLWKPEKGDSQERIKEMRKLQQAHALDDNEGVNE